MTIGLQFDQIGIRGPISAAPPDPSLSHSFPPSFADNFSLLDFVHRSIINEKMPLLRDWRLDRLLHQGRKSGDLCSLKHPETSILRSVFY